MLIGATTISQGGSLVHRAVEDRSQAVRNQIVGIVGFGDAQQEQDGDRIPNFPTNRTLLICNTGDLVCNGQLIILAPHLDYRRRIPEAVNFLVNRLRASGIQ